MQKPFHLYYKLCWLLAVLFCYNNTIAQRNLLLNGNFEELNNCAEYHSECGVEAWFYLTAYQVQLGKFAGGAPQLGNNTLSVHFTWLGDTSMTSVLGTLLPCGLQKGHRYTLAGTFGARFSSRLIARPTVAMGTHFYLPRRPYAKNIQPTVITNIWDEGQGLYGFEYSFIASGEERYVTFGLKITEDETNGKRPFVKKEAFVLTVDNFSLVADDSSEVACANYATNKSIVYQYDNRHKLMDYALYGKGELPITLNTTDTGFITRIEEPPPAPVIVTDTLLLSDVLFDFNKSELKPAAITILQQYFTKKNIENIDSIYVEGHTDAIGSNEQNLGLSGRRSLSVKNWLEKNSAILADKILIHSFGKERPVDTNKTPQGRAKNRRVELVVFRKF